MADITISDLELAPALADDMVLPVENTTDTYAATLAMLRRLINKTFVEVENADFNALTDDGFYQCTGTPTNSPVAGEINWTLQVSAENGVVVQRAFSLDDSFANLYIRRWNGVTWTAWIEVGAWALNQKANISLNNIDATGQAKFDAKANVDLNNLSTAGQAIINGKADINASNFTATGKQTVVGWVMPGYFSKPRVKLKNNVWNYASKNIIVTNICIQNIQGEIYINSKASDDGEAEACSCVSPASGGKSSCQAFIRKGIYYKAVFNRSAWYDELMEG